MGAGESSSGRLGSRVVRELYGAAVVSDAPSRVLAGAARLAAPLLGGGAAASASDDAAALNHGLYW